MIIGPNKIIRVFTFSNLICFTKQIYVEYTRFGHSLGLMFIIRACNYWIFLFETKEAGEIIEGKAKCRILFA
jgi:hypothetical protein